MGKADLGWDARTYVYISTRGPGPLMASSSTTTAASIDGTTISGSFWGCVLMTVLSGATTAERLVVQKVMLQVKMENSVGAIVEYLWRWGFVKMVSVRYCRRIKTMVKTIPRSRT